MSMKKLVVLLLAVSMLVVCFIPANISLAGNYSYTEALEKGIIFFDANKCGPDVAGENVFSWRGACHTQDNGGGKDLTGGYHDAGDHVKFGLPQAYSAATLGWTLYEYKDVLSATGDTQKMLSTLKYFTDYLLKAHPDANTLYHQVGDGGADHAYWGSPENQTGSRPVKSDSGGEVCGLTSAALSIMYLNYKDIDSAYASKCLQAAKTLYAKGKANPIFYGENSFYQSGSVYDDLAWAAVWLYIIENDSAYLTDAETFVTKRNKYNDDPFGHKWTMCWDDMYLPVHLKLAQITGDQKYIDAINFSFNYWMNSLAKTPGGLRYLHNWGVNRYASAEAGLALLYCKIIEENDSLKTFAKSQIDYILGDNPANLSYIIGMGSTWPKHPHHRAAHPQQNLSQAKYELTGALIGGPNATDNFIDDIHQYQYTEVAIDYNASFVFAAAGMSLYYGGISVPSPKPTPTFTYGDLNDDGAVDSTDVTIMKRVILKIPNVTYNAKAADIDGDGSVTSTDLTWLKRKVLKTIDKFPLE